MATIRPQTAPKKRPMTAQQVRPLGRVTVPLRRQVAEHGSNPESVVAALKGDLLTLQRRIDALRCLDRSSNDMEFLERHLLTLNATTGDELATAETINTLLEMLVQRGNVLATTALVCCDEETSFISPGRTGAIIALADFANSIAQRKKMWDATAPSLRDAWSQPEVVPTDADRGSSVGRPGPRVPLDDLLNEPTVSQLRRLIADQRTLQQQLQASLDTSNLAAVKAKEEAMRSTHAVDHLKRQADQALADMTKQRDALQKRVQDLQTELKKFTEHPSAAAGGRSKGHDKAGADDHEEVFREPNEMAIMQRIAGELAFAKVRPATLELVGIDPKTLSLPTPPEAEQIAARAAATLAEVIHAAATDPSSTGKPAKTRPKASTADATANTEGVLWWIVASQADLLEAIDRHVDSLSASLKESRVTSASEIARLNRVIAALNERVNHIKASAIRGAELVHAKTAVDKAAGASVAAGVTNVAAFAKAPVVSVKGDVLSGAQRERQLQGQIFAQQQTIAELQTQLNVANQNYQDELRKTAVAARETAQLLHQSKAEATRTAQAQAGAHALEAEVQSLRLAHQTTKKELREKTAAEAELQQTKWKLEVELQIAQNVIAELRQREERLASDAKEAGECRVLMSGTLDDERRTHAAELAALRSELRASRAEEEVAKQVLRSERARMLEHEREVDRLRTLDLQMEVLEQNFTNYAACKLAQREAVEDEERVLQSCVENIGRDVFVLPSSNDSEEKVRLYLQKLHAAKAAFDAEERTRKRQKATSVNWKDDRSGRKQLAATMQQRYNAIQIFACEQRLRQIQLERTSVELQVQSDESRERNEGLLVELAHAKSQCEGLMQRNAELELQRKEFTRSRVVAEQEIKGLKNTIHKMRVAHEEQEKVLIDIGTRLQQTKSRGDVSPALGV